MPALVRLVVVLSIMPVIGVLFTCDVSAQGGRSAASPGSQVVRVVTEDGRPISGAAIVVRSVNGAEQAAGVTGESGEWAVAGVPAGVWRVRVSASGLLDREVAVSTIEGGERQITVRLSLVPLLGEVTVSAERGTIEDVGSTASMVVVRGAERLQSVPWPTIGHALDGSPGVMLQQTGYGQVSPFVRGLTGYQVLNLVDGVRFNNSTFRSGPNQYLTLLDPVQADRMELVAGPAGAQYGSDSMGGTISLTTEPPRLAGPGEPRYRGELGLAGASADLSTVADAKLSIGFRRVAWLVGVNGRRHGDLRAGGGIDSHHALTRFFGLTPQVVRGIVGTRLQDTGFQSRGWQSTLTARPGAGQHLTFRYQQSRLTDLRNYKDLWGGLGRLQSALEPQSLNLLYARYEKYDTGWFDTLSATFSLNSQADGTVRQGLRGSDRVTTDRSRVDSYGYAGQAGGHLGLRHALVFGGEIYDERITTSRLESDPATGQRFVRRPLYPNGSRYRTTAFFAHDTWEVIRAGGRSPLRATFGVRHTAIGYGAFAASNRDAQGNSLGVVDSALDFADFTWNASLSWHPTTSWGWHLRLGRGFRAPNLNDLGALGLNDLGFEVPAEAVAAAGGLLGTSDGEGVGSSGRQVAPLRPERLLNYELGTSWRSSRVVARTQAFLASLDDPIVRRTVLFPIGQAPATLAGLAVSPLPQTAIQQSQRVVSVATPLDPRAVKAFLNEGAARYYGIEAHLRLVLTRSLAAESGYSFLVGRELNPNRYARRLPPQMGRVALSWAPSSRLALELSGNFSGRQQRLSGGDLTDERIGASRRRRDITDFFLSARVAPFLQPGADGLRGTADDIFSPTGETLTRIRDRVLPIGAIINGVSVVDDSSRPPLYPATPGFVVFNLQASIRLRENVTLTTGLRNLLDRNYRIHGSGIDEPGISAVAGLRFAF